MRPETELKWIALILKSKHIKSFWSSGIPIRRSQFERLCQAPENNKCFAEWFDYLVESDVFVYLEIEKNKGYVAVEKKLLKFAESNELYCLLDKYLINYGVVIKA